MPNRLLFKEFTREKLQHFIHAPLLLLTVHVYHKSGACGFALASAALASAAARIWLGLTSAESLIG